MIVRRPDGVVVPIYENIIYGKGVPIVKDGVLFCSDLHLGSELMAMLRGFPDVKTHDDYIIDILQRQTNKRTLLWILGDVAVEIKDLYKLTKLPCTKRLVLGNHDELPKGAYSEVFDEIHGFVKYKKMWISHCPIHESEFYLKKLNVHGHTHAIDKQTGKDKDLLPLPWFNVNWDFWGRAVSLTEIRTLIPGESK